jgi:hypothetical protein
MTHSCFLSLAMQGFLLCDVTISCCGATAGTEMDFCGTAGATETISASINADAFGCLSRLGCDAASLRGHVFLFVLGEPHSEQQTIVINFINSIFQSKY